MIYVQEKQRVHYKVCPYIKYIQHLASFQQYNVSFMDPMAHLMKPHFRCMHIIGDEDQHDRVQGSKKGMVEFNSYWMEFSSCNS